MFEYRQVLVQMRLGASDRMIAQAGLVGRRKASQLRDLAHRQGWLELSQPLPDDEVLSFVLCGQGVRPQPTARILPYQDEVTHWWQAGIPGTTIHQALRRKYAFEGSYSCVRRFLQSLEKAHPQVTTALDFLPGDVAQVDFGSGPRIIDAYTGEVFSTFIFVMVLCWSRHLFAEIVLDQKVTTWLLCHRHAFEFFGGVPARVMIDNAKCAITRACYYDPEVQRSYGACAEGYGFLIAPCPPRDPQKKGRVESGVKYVKGSFLPLRDFRGVCDANRQLRDWTMAEAGNRIHGSTHEKPLTRFVQTERYLLKPLPDILPEPASWVRVKVHGDCHVQIDKCRYSVPFALVHQTLWVRMGLTSVRIYKNQDLVGVHARLYKPGERSTQEDHLPPQARAYLMRDPQWCLKQAVHIGPGCRELIECLFADQVLDHLRAAQGIIGLERHYGVSRLEAACQRALSFDSPLYRTVKTILERGLDQQPEQLSLPGLSNAYTGGGRFCRDTANLLSVG